MTIAGGAVSELPIASGTNPVGAGGAVYGDGVQESSSALDQVSAKSTLFALLTEATTAGDVAAAPGGAVPGSVSATLDLSDVYAASGLWTAAAQTGATWLSAGKADAVWTPAGSADGGWIKH